MSKKKSSKSINKSAPTLSVQKSALSADNEMQFELELCWCVQQLQTALNSGKLSQKVAEDTAKNLRILTSQTAPLIKKRQVMKLAMGDYRAKMQQEEKKMLLASKQIKFTAPNSTTTKSSFVKKSALATSGKDFRFDFPVPDVDNNGDTANGTVPQIAPPMAITSTKPTELNNVLQTNKDTKFKFNFTIDECNDDINLSGLKLNN